MEVEKVLYSAVSTVDFHTNVFLVVLNVLLETSIDFDGMVPGETG